MKVILTIRGWVEDENRKLLKKEKLTVVRSIDGNNEEFEIDYNMFECDIIVELGSTRFAISDLNKFITKHLGNTPFLNYEKTYVDKIEILNLIKE